jgi:hypothetical protein
LGCGLDATLPTLAQDPISFGGVVEDLLMRLTSKEWLLVAFAVVGIAAGLYYNGFKWPAADRIPYLSH